MSAVGERYAESLFDLAIEENKVDRYLQDMKLVDEVLHSDRKIVQFFSHVLITNDVKYQLLESSFGQSVDKYVLNFLKLLVQSRRIRYIDDIVTGVELVMGKAPNRETGEDGLPVPPYALYNIGNNHPENLLDFVQILSEELVRAGVLPKDYDFESHKELVPMQPGDVPITYADTSYLERDFEFKPSTSLRVGLRHFAEWYKEFYMGHLS